MTCLARPDRLTGIELAALRDLPLGDAFEQPGTAITTLTADLTALWQHHRSDDWGKRRIGRLQLASGAYLQWIGYSDRLAVECSSNTYLRGAGCLTASEEATLLRAGFQPPQDGLPNFWLEVHARSGCPVAAYSVVAVLTALFGVYAG